MRASGGSSRPWGWHALRNDWAARVVEAAGVRPGELVLDLGAGDGALTKHLVEAGARVVAVELHPVRSQHLRARFRDAPVTVINADAASWCLPDAAYRVVASPPYAITAVLLRRLLGRGSRLEAADLVLQRAVVRRYAEGRAPGAGRWLRTYDVHAGCSIPRRAFQPPPRVDSAVLCIRRR